MRKHKETNQNQLSSTVAVQLAPVKAKPKQSRFAVDTLAYWEKRVVRRAFTDGDGRECQAAEWSIRFQHGGRQQWFPLHSGSKATAAAKAREIYLCLVTEGWEITVARFKPKLEAAASLSISEFCDLYHSVLPRMDKPPRPHSARRYIRSLELVARDLKLTKLVDLTTDRIQAFTGDYLAAARKEKRHDDSARVSCNHILRNAGALFSSEALRQYQALGHKLSNPFHGTMLKGIVTKAYTPLPRAVIDGIWTDAPLLRDGDPEAKLPKKNAPRWQAFNFQDPHPEEHTMLLLAMGLGLRRNEIDKAQWDWLATDAKGKHYLEVRETPWFKPKGGTSRVIPIPDELWKALEDSRSHVGPFIVPGPMPASRDGAELMTMHYRLDKHHRALAAWLRMRGIPDERALHRLRKEFGSYVATEFGLYVAQKLLGHASPDITSKHYAGLIQLPDLKHVRL